ncbi:MAG: glycosyltransferase [Clostridia bacterium]|jgi:glycosyltransferase involved in cell wall biosynthesis|nr:glycosyltransferase [Clostridia bacterium]NLS84577.1 glycosyltransferase [Oscillospiraceae bacterium]
MKNENPLVSIIIPVYNASTDLGRCIASARKQSYDNIEILVVNDGSTDASLKICNMYAAVDSRICVIDKANGGVSETRNIAIKQAAGEYIQFLDSDDYLAENATQTLVERALATDADLVISHYYRVMPEDEGGEMTALGFLSRTDVMNKEEFARELMDEPASFYYGVLWNKLYRTEILRKNNILCSEELTWSEDFLFNLEYIRYAERFAAVSTPVYYYVKNRKSITHTQIDLVNLISTKAKLFTYYKELYERIGLYEKYKPQIFKYLISTAEHKYGKTQKLHL